MAGIKFNTATKEIEIKGPESFIESNFDKIMDLLTDSLGVGVDFLCLFRLFGCLLHQSP